MHTVYLKNFGLQKNEKSYLGLIFVCFMLLPHFYSKEKEGKHQTAKNLIGCFIQVTHLAIHGWVDMTFKVKENGNGLTDRHG